MLEDMPLLRSSSPALRRSARILDGSVRDYDALLEMVGERWFVLLGEATHGTHEFYSMRARITQRLVEEQGFDAVAIEGDWPDALHLNRYVRDPAATSAVAAFDQFLRFPTWMWRNRVVWDFVQWLHAHNAALQEEARIGIYGLDLYSLHRSAEAVIAYLERIDPEQAEAAKRLYVCLDHARDPQDYGYAAATGLRKPCRDAARKLLMDLVRKAPEYRADGDRTRADEQFSAERNARVVSSAERYYRAMFSDRASTWNLRDAHMVDTLLALHRHLRGAGRCGRIVVWAHNSHLGDARATSMGERGEWNVGQLLRESVGEDRTLLVGFTTYTGHVTAARDWNLAAEQRWVRPAHRNSYEHALHASGLDRFFLPLSADVATALDNPSLERAIGVVYRPETELESHYFPAVLCAQFDALFHLDETRAIEPLDEDVHWARSEPPDTYPSGL